MDEVAFSCVVRLAGRRCLRHSADRYESHYGCRSVVMIHRRRNIWPTSDESRSARRAPELETEIVGEVAFSRVVHRAGRQCHRHNNGRYEYHCKEMLVFDRAPSMVVDLACL